MTCKTCGPDGCSDRVACPRAAISDAVQQAAEAVGPDGVCAALRTDWSAPAGELIGYMEFGTDQPSTPVYAHQRQAAPRAQEPESPSESRDYLTVVYRVKHGDEARAILSAHEWCASSWSHALHDRDDARRKLSTPRAQEPLYIGACITDGRLHTTLMRREANGHVTVVASADLDASSLQTNDALAKMRVAAPCAPQPAAAPRQLLTDAQIMEAWNGAALDGGGWIRIARAFARAIERACAEQWDVKLDGGEA